MEMPDSFDTLSGIPTRDSDGHIILADRYRVIRELGRGGMGTVYLAEDMHLEDRRVALKMPPAVLARNETALRDLKREALLAMELSHPNIVTLRAFEQGDDAVFLVIDYVDGRTLEQILGEGGPLDEAEVKEIFCPIAQALDYAHSRKVVHRDVKPSNIIIAADGAPYIMDFGIAREMKDTFTRVTGKGTSGTLPYMSPEQVRGLPPSPTQDIYSLAATMYECLSGHPPFYRGQIEYQIINEQPRDIPRIPKRVNAALQTGLAKEGRKRPSQASDLVSMVALATESARGSLGTQARRPHQATTDEPDPFPGNL